ncbi:MAG: polysaccharide biosynthesis protein [Nitrospinaceae bacterium]|nr:MAG: polysaccharide biosynthesis protein [Nitrospinaceae bacterium]
MVADKDQEKTKTAQRLVKNSIWLFSAEGLSKVIALGIQIIAARYLGDKGFGVFGFAFVATGVVVNFIDNGLKVFLTRAISRKPELIGAYLHNVFVLKFLLTLLSVLLFSVAVVIMPLDRETLTVVAVIGFALVVNGYTEMYLGVFRALENMPLVSKLMVFQRILFFVFGLFVLVSGYGVVAFSSAFLISSIVSLLLAHFQLKRPKSSWKKDLNRGVIGNIFQESLPVCGIVFFAYIYFCIDSVLLFLMIGKSATGWYYAAFKLIESLALLLASVRGALFPILSRTYSQNEDQFNRLWAEAARYLLLIGLPFSAGTAILAPQLIDLLYGSLYEITGPVLQIMAIPFFLLVLNEFMAYLLLSADKTRSVLKIVVAAAIFNLICNLFVIPRWGLMGAAVVAGLTELLLFGLFFQSTQKNIGHIPLMSFFWRPVLASAGMGFAIMKVSWPLMPSFVLGVGVYFILLVLLRTFNEFDRLVFRNLLTPQKDSG